MTAKQSHVNPPLAPLRAFRTVTGMTLEELATKVGEVLGLDHPVSRGTLSAIEKGQRGASQQMLDAIAIAYGLAPGTFTTDYKPRASKIHKGAAA